MYKKHSSKYIIHNLFIHGQTNSFENVQTEYLINSRPPMNYRDVFVIILEPLVSWRCFEYIYLEPLKPSVGNEKEKFKKKKHIK